LRDDSNHNNFIIGKYNEIELGAKFIIGDGLDEEHRHNTLVLDSDNELKVLSNRISDGE
jgi:hypothetical protein